MPKLIATHQVDDVAHWLSSPKRVEVFGSVTKDICPHVDPSNPNRVGLSMDVADMEAFQAIMTSDAGAEAMKYDGVARRHWSYSSRADQSESVLGSGPAM